LNRDKFKRRYTTWAKNKGNSSNWWAYSWYCLCIWNA